MIRRRGFVLGVSALALAACSRRGAEREEDAPAGAAQDPASVIRPLYDRYMTPDAQFPDFREQAPWSASMWAALEAMVARSQALNEPILDFDPLIDAQDYQLSNLNVVTESVVENSHAVVRASFNNANTQSEVVYDMIWEQNGWRVDNIRTSQWSLRDIAAAPNADALVPAPAP
jgi:hypothetical protein